VKKKTARKKVGAPSGDGGRASFRENVRFVLVGTTEPGNIGAAARGLKAMGFRRLVLVAPIVGWKSAHAIAMSHGAEDLLDEAEVFGTLDEALADCTWVVGTTKRPRRHQTDTVTPREWAATLAEIPDGEKVAILFGPEKTGLLNEDVLRCRCVVTIPSPVDQPSLNLAQSVMLLAYECGLALLGASGADGGEPLAPDERLEGMYAHMEQALRESRMTEKKVRAVLRHLRVILARARLSDNDVCTFHTLAARIRGPRPRAKPAEKRRTGR
jgi:TrmH family RNA methyltransferase